MIPVICFGYQCHVSVIPIYSCMKHRNIKHFTIASSAAIAVCCFTYTGAATFLEQGDTVGLASVSRARAELLPQQSFFGLVQLADMRPG